MIEILPAIYTQLTTSVATSGYTVSAYRAQPGTQPPYITYSIVYVDHNHTFNDHLDMIHVQFDCFATSGPIVGQMLEDIITVFENVKFPVASPYTMIVSTREDVKLLIDPETKWFHGIVTFNIQMSKPSVY